MKFLKFAFGLVFIIFSFVIFAVLAYSASFMAMFSGLSPTAATFISAALIIYLNFVLFFGTTIFSSCVSSFFRK